MNFPVDAQLPRLLAVRLRELGQRARHTLDLPACSAQGGGADILRVRGRRSSKDQCQIPTGLFNPIRQR